LNKIDFLYVGKNEIGTYPLQSIIENITSHEERTLCLEKVKHIFLELCYDKFGCHLLEKTLTKNEYGSLIQNFKKIIIDNFSDLCFDSNGVKIMKFFAVISYVNSDYEYLNELLFSKLNELVNQQYGNYLLQCIIETWDTSFAKKIVESFKHKYLLLILQKYSSNVIEKLLITLGKVSQNF